MSALTTAELKAQIDTDLPLTALSQIISAVERDIDEYIGPATGNVIQYDEPAMTVLKLPVKTASVTVVEFSGSASEPTKTALSSDDFEVSSDGWELRRLSDGTNSRGTWGWHVEVTIASSNDTARRKQVAIQLARMEITHTGFASERAGDWSGATRELKRERNQILSRLDHSIAT